MCLQVYSESVIPRIAKAASGVTGTPYNELMNSWGVYFLGFVGKYGYDRILKVNIFLPCFLSVDVRENYQIPSESGNYFGTNEKLYFSDFCSVKMHKLVHFSTFLEIRGYYCTASTWRVDKYDLGGLFEYTFCLLVFSNKNKTDTLNMEHEAGPLLTKSNVQHYLKEEMKRSWVTSQHQDLRFLPTRNSDCHRASMLLIHVRFEDKLSMQLTV